MHLHYANLSKILIFSKDKTRQMTTTSEYIEALRGYKTKKSELHGIARIGIFGSVARNEQNTDSDVDICVEPKRPSLFTLVYIKEELQELFGRPLDIVASGWTWIQCCIIT